MIDTVKVRFPVSDVQEHNFLSISYSQFGNIKYKVHKNSFAVPSSSSVLNVFVNTNNECILEFSVPKFMFGHNCKSSYFSDLPKVFSSIEKELFQYMLLPRWQDWEVLRLDLCEMIRSQNPQEDMILFQLCRFPRQKRFIYDTSVMFKGSSYSSKFYLKQPEFIKNDFKKFKKSPNPEVRSYGYEIKDWLASFIRFEVTMRKNKLTKLLKTDKVVLGDLEKKKYKEKLKEEKKEIKSKLYGNIVKVRGFDNHRTRNLRKYHIEDCEILALLEEFYPKSKASRLYQFFLFTRLYNNNDSVLRMLFSPSTISRNRSEIAKVIDFL